MQVKAITPGEAIQYDALVFHPLQSYEWGEFREKTGVKVIRRGFYEDDKLVHGLTLTIHPIPHTKYTIGYLPKGKMPTKELLEELKKIGREENCIFIQLEPNVVASVNSKLEIRNLKLTTAAHPLFTKYTFILDLNKSEDELLAGMHQKTRYNIRVAQKHGVEVKEDNSDDAFREYIRLTEETTKRQGFYAHSRKYHEQQWETFTHGHNSDSLTSHLLIGRFEGKALSALLFFVFKDTLYYPYGASSNESRNTMHSTLTMWEGIRLGKKLGLKNFDMWGAAETENPAESNPYYGFHRFKQGFGANYTEFIGSYDLVIKPQLYQLYKITDKLRWMYLRLKK